MKLLILVGLREAEHRKSLKGCTYEIEAVYHRSAESLARDGWIKLETRPRGLRGEGGGNLVSLRVKGRRLVDDMLLRLDRIAPS